jgi:phage/plasmid-associated DNA primase
MKSLFGNDTIVARGLYQDEIKFKPQATGFLSCNVLPNIAPDDGTFRRLRVLRFPYKFTFEEPKNKFEKSADPNLISRLDTLKDYLASYLIHRYRMLKKHQKGILHTPQYVIDETNKYKAKSDIYQAFVNEGLPKDVHSVNAQSLFEVFQEWLKNENIKREIKKRDFVENIEGKLGDLEPNGSWIIPVH